MMSKTDLEKSMVWLNHAKNGLGAIDDKELANCLILSIGHLIEHCRKKVADKQALDNLAGRVSEIMARVSELEIPGEPGDMAELKIGEMARPHSPGLEVLQEWRPLLDEVVHDCRIHGWTDVDASIAWQIGRAAMLKARGYGGRFPHDPVGDAS